MIRPVRYVEIASRKPLLMGLLMYAATLGAIWVLGRTRLTTCTELGPIILFSVVIVIPAVTTLLFYSFYSLFDENVRLRACARDVHDLNHLYRNCLSDTFSSLNARRRIEMRSELAVLQVEQAALNRACQIIAGVFGNLINRRCMVTVKLLQQGADGDYCFTYARSETATVRDRDGNKLSRVGSGENTAFDEAMALKPNAPSHFSSEDLLAIYKKGRYFNQRQAWERCYRSSLVVPIRCVVDREKGIRDDIGFLCVDTMSTNRLGREHHVNYLAAFADQMYNFMSLMRGKYKLAGPLGALEHPAILDEEETTEGD